MKVLIAIAANAELAEQALALKTSAPRRRKVIHKMTPEFKKAKRMAALYRKKNAAKLRRAAAIYRKKNKVALKRRATFLKNAPKARVVRV